MSEVVESVDIEVGIVVSEKAKKAIEEVQKELDKITDPGDAAGAPGAGGGFIPGLTDDLGKAKEAAHSFAEEMKQIREAGEAYLDQPFNFGTNRSRLDRFNEEQEEIRKAREKLEAAQAGRAADANDVSSWEGEGGAIAAITEAGKAAEATLDRINSKAEEVSKTVGKSFGESIGDAWGSFQERAEEKFEAVTESGRTAAKVLRDAFGPNLFADAIEGAVDLLDKTKGLGAGLQKLGGSVSAWAPKVGAALTGIGTAITAVVPIVVGAAGAILGSVTAFAAAFALPITAVVAVVGTLAYAWRSASEESKKAIADMEKADELLRKLKPRARQAADQGHARTVGSAGDELRGEIDAASQLDTLAEKFAAIDSAVAGYQSRMQEYVAQNQKLAESGDVVGGTDAGNLGLRIEIFEQVRAAQQDKLELAQAAFKEIEKETNELRVQLDLQKEKAKLALDVLDRQEQARQSIQEKLGRMEAGQQAEVLDLLKEIQGGSATADQVKQFEDLFGAIDETRQFYAEQSTATVEQLDALGAKLSEQDAKLLAAAEKLAGGKGIEAIEKFLSKLADDEEKLNQTMADATEELEKTTAELTEVIAALTKTINTMKKELEELKFAQRNNTGGGV